MPQTGKSTSGTVTAPSWSAFCRDTDLGLSMPSRGTAVACLLPLPMTAPFAFGVCDPKAGLSARRTVRRTGMGGCWRHRRSSFNTHIALVCTAADLVITLSHIASRSPDDFLDIQHLGPLVS